jgi:hypothetical protein
MLNNSTGRLALTIVKSAFAAVVAPHGQQNALVAAGGSAAVELTVRNSNFQRSVSHALDVTGDGKSSITLRVTGSSFDRSASAINLSAIEEASLQYVIADNPAISGSENAAINIYLGTPSVGTISGTIARNTIGKSGVSRSGAACDSCSGISFNASGRGIVIANVTGNVIQQVGGPAISAVASQGSSQLHLSAAANLLREGGSAAAIRVQSGALATDSTRVCASLGGPGAQANKIEGPWDPNGAIQVIHRFGGSRMLIAGLSGGKTETAAAASIAARNGGVKVRAVLRPDSMEKGFEAATEPCRMPALAP